MNKLFNNIKALNLAFQSQRESQLERERERWRLERNESKYQSRCAVLRKIQLINKDAQMLVECDQPNGRSSESDELTRSGTSDSLSSSSL